MFALVYRFLVDETKPQSVGNTFVLRLTQIMDTTTFLKETTRLGNSLTDCCFVKSQERGMSAARWVQAIVLLYKLVGLVNLEKLMGPYLAPSAIYFLH